MIKKFLYHSVSLAFIINLLASSISNYTINSLYIKIASGLLTFTIILALFKPEIRDLLNITVQKKTPLFTLSFFLIYSVTSLSWSTNPEFGFYKILHLIIGNFPLIILIYIIFLNDNLIGLLIRSFLIVGIISAIATFIINPFNPALPYSFEINRWSHVVYGRFAGLTVLISLLILSNEKERIKILFFTLISVLIFSSLLSSGFRGGIIGVVLSIIIYYLIISLKEKCYRKNIMIILITGLILFTSIIISISYSKNAGRFSGLFELIVEGRTEDGTINSRIEAYRIGLKMFFENPFFGAGFGAFNTNNYESTIGTILKYPHNILIELACELGIFGLAFFILFVRAVMQRLINDQPELLAIFIYGTLLAMFSKDIGSNGLVWIFIVCLMRKNLMFGSKKIST
ncbi:MAG: O-antigen ligase family protein [Bacteroidota bacterium]